MPLALVHASVLVPVPPAAIEREKKKGGKKEKKKEKRKKKNRRKEAREIWDNGQGEKRRKGESNLSMKRAKGMMAREKKRKQVNERHVTPALALPVHPLAVIDITVGIEVGSLALGKKKKKKIEVRTKAHCLACHLHGACSAATIPRTP
jgi:hypothetical protein